MRRWSSASPAQTEEVGAKLARELLPDGLVLLKGPLGAGKTVIVKGLARGLGIDPREIQSPTFTLMREHQGSGGRLFHLDLYRLESEQTSALGLDEVLAGEGVKAVEWPERLPVGALAGLHGLTIELRLSDDAERRQIFVEPFSGDIDRSVNSEL